VPELPEVQTIVDDLRPLLRGRTITEVRLSWPNAVSAPDVNGFIAGLCGQRIESMTRHGKYIALRLSGGRYLVLHLKMTGALLWRHASDPPDRFTQTVLTLDDGHELRFTDVRKFGRQIGRASCRERVS
jgi:formamidopyrimidine-DNA glycosylase